MGTETLTPEQEAQALWDEVAAERQGTTATTPPTEAKEEPKTEEPAEEPKEETPPEEPEVKTEPEPDKPDPLAELVTRFEKLEGRQRNVEGHIGGLKDGQQRMLEMLSAAKTAAANTDDAPTQSQVKEAFTSPAKWESLKKEFPEWADATEALLDARIAGMKPGASVDPAEIDKIVSERIASQTESIRKEIAETTLEAQFPGWRKEVKTEAFGKWMNTQPEEVKALAASEDVGDAARLLRLYESAKQADPADRINAERQQRLAAAVSTPKGVRAPAQKSPSDMTPEELWDYEAKQREKARSQRGY